MGVNLGGLVGATAISLDGLAGKVLAVDAYNTLYQFLSIIRDRMTGEPLRDSEGRVTSHLSGVFYRTSSLLEAGARPVFVFDGKPPAFKRMVIEERQKAREEAAKKWKAALEEGRVEAARIAATASARLTKEMVEESKALLKAMGVPWVQAPSEGEAQAARMVKDGLAWASASQDWDSLLFGAPRMARNVTVSGKRKVPYKEKYIEVSPELIVLDDALRSLGITQEQLITIGILTGTDYCPAGVRGIGPKKALKLVKEKGSFAEALKSLGSGAWACETPAEEIYTFFLNPPTERVDIPAWKCDAGAVRRIMSEHSFSEERVEKVLERLDAAGKEKQQAGLNAFLGKK